MITILHGNDIVSSRNALTKEKEKHKNPLILNGEGLLFDDFYKAVEGNTLFDGKPYVFIENFFSKSRTSEDYKKILNYINTSKERNIFFWEEDELSKTTLFQVKNAEKQSFQLPQNLFLFLDSIRPQNGKYLLSLYHSLRKTSEDELIFFMILRQFRLLLNISSNKASIDEAKRLAPWQISKFKTQIKYFGQENLVKNYNKLFEIENAHKTGKVSFGIDKSIDFFLLGL